MKIQIKIKYVLWIIGFALGYYLWNNLKLVNTPVKKKLIEKVVTSDRYGKPFYHYPWKLQDGTTETQSRDFDWSEGFEVGKTYIFNQQTIEFK